MFTPAQAIQFRNQFEHYLPRFIVSHKSNSPSTPVCLGQLYKAIVSIKSFGSWAPKSDQTRHEGTREFCHTLDKQNKPRVSVWKHLCWLNMWILSPETQSLWQNRSPLRSFAKQNYNYHHAMRLVLSDAHAHAAPPGLSQTSRVSRKRRPLNLHYYNAEVLFLGYHYKPTTCQETRLVNSLCL